MEEYQQQDLEAAQNEQEQAATEIKEDEKFLQEDNPQNYGGGLIGYSEPKPIGGLYALFQDILDRPSTIKVSNLDNRELGDIGMTVRDCLKIALIGQTFKHYAFANFFLQQAGIVTDTSMSKKGWFPELFVTSKKFAQRDTSQSVNIPQQQKQSKWSIFSKPAAAPVQQ